MKIIIISCVFPPEPVVSANLSYDLAVALSIRHEVTVLSPKPSRPMGYDFSGTSNKEHPFKHIILQSFTHPKSTFIGRFLESHSFGRACVKYINNHQKEIDLIYMNTWPLFGQYLAVKASNKLNIPAVVHIQDIYPEAFVQKLPTFLKYSAFNLLFPFDKYVTTKSKKIVTISSGMKNMLANTRKVPATKIEVVYNWQDDVKFLVNIKNEMSDIIGTQIHFMFLGSLGPTANIDNLIRALVRVETEEIRLTIAGEGSEKTKLQKLAQDYNDPRISFMSAPSSKAGTIQSKASVLLLSLKKGAAGLALPSKLPAYMFSAKPIIATVDLDSDTAKAIKEAGCGWVIEPENPDELAALMKKIHKMPKSELKAKGLKGRDYASKYFSKKSNLAKLVATIQEIENQ